MEAEPVEVETRNGRSNLINEAKDEALKLVSQIISLKNHHKMVDASKSANFVFFQP